MAERVQEIFPITIEDELKQSYLDYAMSVIVGRALPDAKDGLKPVHRRVLYAMHELGNDWNKPYKKSARVVGDVIGKYHPHGDTAVYDTLVRMAQPFSLRYMLIDGQGNFGSVDGDAPAAMRYTEVRMSKFAHVLLADLEKETVDFAPNYDESEFAPSVLPTRAPNLLINGSSGIAVGMATNIPPHNLGEVIDACIALIHNPGIGLDKLMEHIHGPDFPTAGIINGRSGIIEAYRTGRGRIYVRARTHIETDDKSNKQTIIITELPYQVNKARLVEKIAVLVKDKKIEGITGLRDESDKEGMRVVIELRRGENAEVIINNLYTQTQLQNVFGINMVALVDGQPRLLNLKTLLEVFVRHRREVVTRRTLFDLRKAKERAHLLEGLAIALGNIDMIVALIKAAQSPQAAKEALLAQPWPLGSVADMLARSDENVRPEDLAQHYGQHEQGYLLSPAQAQAILDLRLHRLTGLEQDKIFKEYKTLLDLIENLLEILTNPERLLAVIEEELIEVKTQFADERRSEIIASQLDIVTEDLIPDESVVVTLSREGYVKCQPQDTYQAQRRGGRGKSATDVKNEDVIEILLTAMTHDTILCFSDKGKVYWLKAYQLPQASRASRGRPFVNILPLEQDERINTLLPVRLYDKDHYVIMVTAQGVIKKVELTAFSRPRTNGIRALDLTDDDYLVGAAITDGQQDVMLSSDAGKIIRFSEDNVRAMGRSARGIRGIRLQPGQRVISLIIPTPDCEILTATENGYGKCTPASSFSVRGRGGQGVISIQVNERNGQVVGAIAVNRDDEVVFISDQGTLVRTRVGEVSVVGRAAQGVRLMNLGEGEKLVAVQRVMDSDDEMDSEVQEN